MGQTEKLQPAVILLIVLVCKEQWHLQTLFILSKYFRDGILAVKNVLSLLLSWNFVMLQNAMT